MSSDYGFKVSKDGYDVATATPDQLAVTSALLSEKVALYGFVSVNVASSASDVQTVRHGLGYAPQVVVYDFGSDMAVPFVLGDTTGAFYATDCYVDSTNLYIRTTQNGPSALNLFYYYQILYNPI